MPSIITSVDEQKFHQLSKIIEQTIQKIKNSINSGANSLDTDKLIRFLELSVQKQNLLMISATQTPNGAAVEMPSCLAEESSEQYAERVKQQYAQLQRAHSETLVELEYQRRAHQACHDEVHRLRRLLRSLMKNAAAAASGNGKLPLSYERFRQFRNKLAKKLMRYNQVVDNLSQSLRAALNERQKVDGSASDVQTIVDRVELLAKELAADKMMILGLSQKSLEEDQRLTIGDLNQALAEEVEKQLALYDRVLELEACVLSVDSQGNNEHYPDSDLLAVAAVDQEPFPCEMLTEEAQSSVEKAGEIISSEANSVPVPSTASVAVASASDDAVAVTDQDYRRRYSEEEMAEFSKPDFCPRSDSFLEPASEQLLLPTTAANQQPASAVLSDVSASRKSSIVSAAHAPVTPQTVETDFIAGIGNEKADKNIPEESNEICNSSPLTESAPLQPNEQQNANYSKFTEAQRRLTPDYILALPLAEDREAKADSGKTTTSAATAKQNPWFVKSGVDALKANLNFVPASLFDSKPAAQEASGAVPKESPANSTAEETSLADIIATLPDDVSEPMSVDEEILKRLSLGQIECNPSAGDKAERVSSVIEKDQGTQVKDNLELGENLYDENQPVFCDDDNAKEPVVLDQLNNSAIFADNKPAEESLEDIVATLPDDVSEPISVEEEILKRFSLSQIESNSNEYEARPKNSATAIVEQQIADDQNAVFQGPASNIADRSFPNEVPKTEASALEGKNEANQIDNGDSPAENPHNLLEDTEAAFSDNVSEPVSIEEEIMKRLSLGQIEMNPSANCEADQIPAVDATANENNLNSVKVQQNEATNNEAKQQEIPEIVQHPMGDEPAIIQVESMDDIASSTDETLPPKDSAELEIAKEFPGAQIEQLDKSVENDAIKAAKFKSAPASKNPWLIRGGADVVKSNPIGTAKLNAPVHKAAAEQENNLEEIPINSSMSASDAIESNSSPDIQEQPSQSSLFGSFAQIANRWFNPTAEDTVSSAASAENKSANEPIEDQKQATVAELDDGKEKLLQAGRLTEVSTANDQNHDLADHVPQYTEAPAANLQELDEEYNAAHDPIVKPQSSEISDWDTDFSMIPQELEVHVDCVSGANYADENIACKIPEISDVIEAAEEFRDKVKASLPKPAAQTATDFNQVPQEADDGANEQEQSRSIPLGTTALTNSYIIGDIVAAVQEREAVLADKAKQAEVFNQALGEIEAAVQDRESAQAEKAKQADALKRSLEDLKTVVAEREEKQADKSKQANIFNQALGEIEAAVQDRESHQAEKAKQADALKQSLEDLKTVVAEREEAQAEKAIQAKVFNQALGEIEAAVQDRESTLAEKSKVADMLKQSLVDLQSTVGVRDAEMEQQVNQGENQSLGDIQANVADFEAAQTEKAKQANIFNQALGEIEAAVQDRESHQAEKAKQADALKRSLEDLKTVVAEREETQAEKAKQAEVFNQALGGIEAAVQDRESHQAEKAKQADALKQSLKDLETVVAEREEAQADKTKQAKVFNQALGEIEAAVADREATLTEKARQADVLKLSLENLKTAVADREAEKEQREKQAEAFNLSLSELPAAVELREAEKLQQLNNATTVNAALKDEQALETQREASQIEKADNAAILKKYLEELPIAIAKMQKLKEDREKAVEKFDCVLNEMTSQHPKFAANDNLEAEAVPVMQEENDFVESIDELEAAETELIKQVENVHEEAAVEDAEQPAEAGMTAALVQAISSETEKPVSDSGATPKTSADDANESLARLNEKSDDAGLLNQDIMGENLVCKDQKISSQKSATPESAESVAENLAQVLNQMMAVVAKKNALMSKNASRADPEAKSSVEANETTNGEAIIPTTNEAGDFPIVGEEILEKFSNDELPSSRNNPKEMADNGEAVMNPLTNGAIEKISEQIVIEDKSNEIAGEETGVSENCKGQSGDEGEKIQVKSVAPERKPSEAMISEEAVNEVANLPPQSFANRYKSLLERIEQSASALSDIEGKDAVVQERQRLGSVDSTAVQNNLPSRRLSNISNPFSDSNALAASQTQSRRASAMSETQNELSQSGIVVESTDMETPKAQSRRASAITEQSPIEETEEAFLDCQADSNSLPAEQAETKRNTDGISSWFKPLTSLFSSKSLDKLSNNEHQVNPISSSPITRRTTDAEDGDSNSDTLKEKALQLAALEQNDRPVKEEDLTILDSQSNVAYSKDSLERSLDYLNDSNGELDGGSQPVLVMDDKQQSPEEPSSCYQTYSSSPVLKEEASIDQLGALLDKGFELIDEEGLKTVAVIDKRVSVASVTSIAPFKQEIQLKSEQVKNVPSVEEVAQVLSNPEIPEYVKTMMRALVEENTALKEDLNSLMDARKNDAAAVKDNVDVALGLVANIRRTSMTYVKNLEEENNALNSELKQLKIDGQLRVAREKVQESIDANADNEIGEKIQMPTLNLEVLGLLGRLKKIWRDLMQLYIESSDVPDVSPITDIDFILDQIDISVQILTSYIDTNVHEAQFPYVHERHLNELESLAEEVKEQISSKALMEAISNSD